MAELGAEVVALDVSERMVELARARGVDARVGDVQELPFADASFDTVVAAWMLYHVPDLDRGLAEIARVLAPGGRLVAVTNSELPSRGGACLRRREHGRSGFLQPGQRRRDPRAALRVVERTDVDGWVTFPDAEAIRRYIRSMIDRGRERRPRPRRRRPCARRDPGDRVRCSTPMSGTDRGRRGALLERDR